MITEPAREFRMIADHFRPLAGPEALGLLDDAAVWQPDPGEQLVISSDAMVEGTHFLPHTNPGLIARKLLRVNLSDLAAMGAKPLGYLLTLCLPPGTSDEWMAAFAAGLAADQQEFGITLWGGDTTRIDGPMVGSITVHGTVPIGQSVRRSGARPGDQVFVTGTVGDGVLGLFAARNEIADPDGYLAGRYRLPTPRNSLAIRNLASAAMDISDGLISELGHIARASKVAITVQTDLIPISPQARAHLSERRHDIIAGGDDYELLLTVPPEKAAALQQNAQQAGVPLTRIGICQAGGADVSLIGPDGAPFVLAKAGWSHF